MCKERKGRMSRIGLALLRGGIEREGRGIVNCVREGGAEVHC